MRRAGGILGDLGQGLPASSRAQASWHGKALEPSDQTGLALRIAILRKDQPSTRLPKVPDARKDEIAVWRTCRESITCALIKADLI